MTTDVATTTTTTTLPVPGAVLTYDIRAGGDTALRPLMIIGSPMGASGFPTLAGHFPDRTVITYDPRGVERSTKDDPTSQSTPEQHADDVHRIIQALGLGPVDLFASSGGAVNALALVAAHPDDVHTLVAHEPPAGGARPRPRGCARGLPRGRPDLPAAWLRRRHGPLHRPGLIPGAVHARVRGPARPGSEDVRDADRGRRHAHGCAARPEPVDLHVLSAGHRRAAWRFHDHRHRGGRQDRRGAGPSGGRGRRASAWARTRSSSRATTAGSWVASTARPASPMPSRRSCGRCSTQLDLRCLHPRACTARGCRSGAVWHPCHLFCESGRCIKVLSEM